MSGMTNDLFGFSFPVIIPVFIYMQEMLIGVIQALVFSLLIAIFIKVARVS
jgi:F0F1-type ATP synthase membrane subunit a